MITTAEKHSRLADMDEETFRREVLVPLLRKMGFKDVRERHGPAEYGKDITFLEENPLGKTFCAVVAKTGTISGASGGKDNLATVKIQVAQAYDMPFCDMEGKKKQSINRVIVWTTGNISDSAQSQVVESLSANLRNVHFKDGQATVELIDYHFPTFFSIGDAFLSEYFTGAKEYYSRLEELRTLGTSCDQLRLPVIFVPPILKPYIPRISGAKADTKSYSLEDLLAVKDNLLILGQMGSGKSTLLRRVMLAIIERNEALGKCTPIPFLLRIKALDLDREGCIEGEIEREFRRFSPNSDAQESIEARLQADAVLLLDGLDELKEDRLIIQALERVQGFLAKYPAVRIMATSRLIDIIDDHEALSKFLKLKVKDVTPAQAERFVRNWFGEGTANCARMLKLVRDPQTMHCLPSTPMTLALIAILYSGGVKEIPANLTELFSKYVELALGRWDTSKDVSQQYEWKIKEFLLKGVSWHLHKNRRLSIEKDVLDEILGRISEERGLAVSPTVFRQEVVDRTELMLDNENCEYEFKHRAFQDYFAGLELLSSKDSLALITDNFQDSWWDQAIFFACGTKPDSEDYLKEILDRVVPSEEGSYTYAMNLGLAMQASYLAPVPLKREGVKRVIDQFVRAWDHFEKRGMPTDGQMSKEVLAIPSFMITAIIGFSAQQALGAVSLAQVVQDNAENLLREGEAARAGDAKAFERKCFFIALAGAHADNVDLFVKLHEQKCIEDPALFLFTCHEAERILDNSALAATAHAKLSKLVKWLKKSISANQAYLERFMKAATIAKRLPSPE